MLKIGYLIKESLRGWATHKQVTLPTLLTIGLCTFILTGSFLILKGIWNFEVESDSRWKVEVFLTSGQTSEYQNYGQLLKQDPAVSQLKFISPEMAWSRFQQDFGPELLQELDHNPLPASWEFTVASDYQSSYRMSSLLKRLKAYDWVDEISSSSKSLEMLESWGVRLKLSLSMIVIFLAFMIWLILKNSVRMSLYSRQLLVENMKYIGASEFYIGFPFILEAILQASIASVISFGVWHLIFDFIAVNLPMIGEIFVMDWSLFPFVFGFLVFIGVLTSWRTVQLYLRETWEA